MQIEENVVFNSANFPPDGPCIMCGHRVPSVDCMLVVVQINV